MKSVEGIVDPIEHIMHTRKAERVGALCTIYAAQNDGQISKESFFEICNYVDVNVDNVVATLNKIDRSENYKEIVDSVRRKIRKNGESGYRDLTLRRTFVHIPQRYLNDVLDSLQAAGEVRKVTKRGREVWIYCR